MQTQSSEQYFEPEDFLEVPPKLRSKPWSPVLAGICVALAVLLLATLLIRGSLPEMSPEQIVAMDGYQGEQPPRRIFNLDSLNDTLKESVVKGAESAAGSTSAVPQKGSPNALRDTLPAPDTQPQVVVANEPEPGPVAEPNGAQDTRPDDVAIASLFTIEAEEPQDSWAREIVEIPVSPIMVGKDAQEVAAPMVEQFDFRKLNRREKSPVATSGSGLNSAGASTDSELSELTSTIKVLPVLTVNADNTVLRAEPTETSDIKLVLASGASVTAFEQDGAWVHVGANDGSSVTGYVHQSKIASSELN